MRPSLPDSLFDVLERQSRQNGGTPAIRTSTGEATFAELYDRCRRHLAGMQGLAGRRVALAMEPCPAWISLAGALARSGAHLFLLSPHLEASRRDELVNQFSFHAIIGPDGEMRSLSDHQAAGLPGVTIFTSGSTGTPKAVTHSWTSLLRPVRRRPELEHSRWMLTYPVRFYSGLQVQLQSLASGGTLTVADRRSAATVCRQIYQENIQYVPATPSFWRWLLAFGDLPALRKSSLEHISLGGEPVSGELLQALHAAFPRARIVHIYATSELGRCFSVTDGQAGFPAEYLARCPEPGVSLRVVDGELQIRSDNAMRGYEGHAGDGAGWIATGDLVDISGGRVRFRGRNTEIINVGGSKVSPVEVETALRRVPGIADLRVYPVASSLAGQLVAADFVLAPGSRAEELRAAIARACAGLPNCQRPRILRFVDRLSILDSGKLDRQSQQESAA